MGQAPSLRWPGLCLKKFLLQASELTLDIIRAENQGGFSGYDEELFYFWCLSLLVGGAADSCMFMRLLCGRSRSSQACRPVFPAVLFRYDLQNHEIVRSARLTRQT